MQIVGEFLGGVLSIFLQLKSGAFKSDTRKLPLVEFYLHKSTPFHFFAFRGVLSCLDGYMNIALEQTEEYVNGQLKNKYGDAFIRGNNVLYISTQKRRV